MIKFTCEAIWPWTFVCWEFFNHSFKNLYIYLIITITNIFGGFSGGSVVKIHCQCKRHGFYPWIRKFPKRRKWQATPVLFPGKIHKQRNLAAAVYRVTESDTAEWLSLSSHMQPLWSHFCMLDTSSLFVLFVLLNSSQ